MSDTPSGTATDAAVPQYPMERSMRCPFAPPPLELELAAANPLSRVRIWDGSTPWLITGYAEAKALFYDPRVSVDDRRPGFPHWNEGMRAMSTVRPGSVFNRDLDEHARHRRMLTKPFALKRVEALRSAIQKITDEHIDAMLAGPRPADLVAALALPVPSLVISELLGVPYEDHEFFQDRSNVGLGRNNTAEETQANVVEMINYLADLVDAKAENPAEDAISDLAERVKAGEIDRWEAAMQGVGLLFAGHETTGNMIGLGTLALLEHPEQLAVVRDTDDPKVLANAIEELLRYLSIIHTGQRRVAMEDIEIGGEVIRADEGIIIDLAPANWDPNTFQEPGRLDSDRANANQHMAFGHGRHQCVGQQLARAELQIVFQTLFRRIPTLRLATTIDRVDFKHDRLAYGVYELPVEW
ncbi:cytochrome P450 [Nocardia vinacea]|uniref:Cytochrome P450 n=1 Tax=Nocardia vinacea TaxID=96468 RepID=A0ABZ1Z049_9NOCA|nr:cytochrome P450 [Nocardia vinacea]